MNNRLDMNHTIDAQPQFIPPQRNHKAILKGSLLKESQTAVYTLFAFGLAACGGGGGGGGTAATMTQTDTNTNTNTDTPAPTPAVSGVAMKGPLEGAFAFIDVNGNGVWDDGTDSARVETAADGAFSIPNPENLSGDLVVQTTSTTIDNSSGEQIGEGFTFRAPSDYAVVSPATTLVTEILDDDEGLSAAEVEQNVKSALGLAGDIDLKNFNPYGESVDEGHALEYEKLAQQIMSVANSFSEVSANAGGNKQNAVSSALDSIAELVVERAAEETVTAIDFTENTDLDVVISKLQARDTEFAAETQEGGDAFSTIASLRDTITSYNKQIDDLSDLTEGRDVFKRIHTELENIARDAGEGRISLLGGTTITFVQDKDNADIKNLSAASVTESASLQEAIEGLATTESLLDPDGNPYLEGVVVLHDGNIIAEQYYGDSSATDANRVYSVTKSFMSALYGRAIETGDIQTEDIDKTLAEIFPDETLSEFAASVTVKQLLQMRSGYEDGFAFENLLAGTATQYFATTGQSELLDMNQSSDNPSGDFFYNNSAQALLTYIFYALTDEIPSEFAADHFFSELGINMSAANIFSNPDLANLTTTPYVDGDGNEVSVTENSWLKFTTPTVANSEGQQEQLDDVTGGMFLTLRDMAKLGQLYLQNGHTGGDTGKQIISWDWVNSSVTTPDDDAYGYSWWLDQSSALADDGTPLENVYSAQGLEGQYIYVLPDQDVVIAIQSREQFYDTDGEFTDTYEQSLTDEISKIYTQFKSDFANSDNGHINFDVAIDLSGADKTFADVTSVSAKISADSDDYTNLEIDPGEAIDWKRSEDNEDQIEISIKEDAQIDPRGQSLSVAEFMFTPTNGRSLDLTITLEASFTDGSNFTENWIQTVDVI